jgi:hypothetical protein
MCASLIKFVALIIGSIFGLIFMVGTNSLNSFATEFPLLDCLVELFVSTTLQFFYQLFRNLIGEFHVSLEGVHQSNLDEFD